MKALRVFARWTMVCLAAGCVTAAPAASLDEVISAAADARSLLQFDAVSVDMASLPPSDYQKVMVRIGETNLSLYVYLVQQFLVKEELFDGRPDGVLKRATIRAITKLCKSSSLAERCSGGPATLNSILAVTEVITKKTHMSPSSVQATLNNAPVANGGEGFTLVLPTAVEGSSAAGVAAGSAQGEVKLNFDRAAKQFLYRIPSPTLKPGALYRVSFEAKSQSPLSDDFGLNVDIGDSNNEQNVLPLIGANWQNSSVSLMAGDMPWVDFNAFGAFQIELRNVRLLSLDSASPEKLPPSN